MAKRTLLKQLRGLTAQSNAFAIAACEQSRRGDIVRKILDRCLWVDRGSEYGPCLEWQGPDSGKPGRGKAGRGHSYARMCIDGVTSAVHRVLWITLNGFLPSKKQLDHLCNNRRCVLHCEPVTHKENQRRRDRARKLSQGHIHCEAVAEGATGAGRRVPVDAERLPGAS